MFNDELKEIRHATVYLSELFAKFNEMNLHLQGIGINLMKAKSDLCVYFTVNSIQMEHRLPYQFLDLSDLEEKDGIQDDDLQGEVLGDHLDT